MLRLAPAVEPAFFKLGGDPEMPPELAWPSGPAGPLTFVAQLDAAEARAAGGPEWLPPAGALFLFFDDQLDRIDGRLGEMTVLFARSALLPTVEDLYEACSPDHRVGGYPAELQPECLPARCESSRRGFDSERTDWRLLLQIDADGALGMEAVDGGRIFVLVRRQDARAGDFSKAICVLHFHHAADASAPFEHDCGISWA